MAREIRVFQGQLVQPGVDQDAQQSINLLDGSISIAKVVMNYRAALLFGSVASWAIDMGLSATNFETGGDSKSYNVIQTSIGTCGPSSGVFGDNYLDFTPPPGLIVRRKFIRPFLETNGTGIAGRVDYWIYYRHVTLSETERLQALFINS